MHSPLFESLALVSHDNVFLWIHTDRVVPGLMLHLTPPGCDGNKYVHFEFYFYIFFFIVELPIQNLQGYEIYNMLNVTTVAINEYLLCMKNVGAQIPMDFS